jgi:FkbM family methyltransferase
MVTRSIVPPGAVCWDVGANIGIYTLLLSALVGPTGVVEAFEPSPVAWERLMFHLANCENVRAHHVALSDTSGTARLAVAGGDSMHSALRPCSGVPGHEVDVPTVTADSRLDRGDIQFLDFVKVDIEGHEERFVAGAGNALRDRRIGALLLEVAPQYGSTAWIDELAQIPGYELFAIVRRDGVWPLHRPRLSARSISSFMATGHGFSLAVISEERTANVAKLIVD